MWEVGAVQISVTIIIIILPEASFLSSSYGAVRDSGYLLPAAVHPAGA